MISKMEAWIIDVRNNKRHSLQDTPYINNDMSTMTTEKINATSLLSVMVINYNNVSCVLHYRTLYSIHTGNKFTTITSLALLHNNNKN